MAGIGGFDRMSVGIDPEHNHSLLSFTSAPVEALILSSATSSSAILAFIAGYLPSLPEHPLSSCRVDRRAAFVLCRALGVQQW